MAANAPNPKPPNQAAAWTRNAVVLVAMTLLIVCGYRACVPDDPTTTVTIAEEIAEPLPPLDEEVAVIEEEPLIEPEPWTEPEPEPVAEAVVVVPPVAAAPAAKAAASKPVAAKKPTPAPKRGLETGPILGGVAAAGAAGAAGAAAGTAGGAPGAVPPVGAAGPAAFAAAPAPPAEFLPIGPATTQFTDPLAPVGSDAATAFGVRPGLPLPDTSLAVIQPCDASSCNVNVGSPVGPVGFVIVGGGWPPPGP
jgi:hypothetical protein